MLQSATQKTASVSKILSKKNQPKITAAIYSGKKSVKRVLVQGIVKILVQKLK